MKKLITLLIGCSLALPISAWAKPADAKKNEAKKPKAVQKQVAPKQQSAPKHLSAPKQHPAPNPHVQNIQPQHKAPPVQSMTKVHKNNVPTQHVSTMPAVQKNKMNKPASIQADTSNQLRAAQVNNKNVTTFRPRHQNFHATPKAAITSAQYNPGYRIQAAQNWNGTQYNVFRSYQPQWHDRGWWSSHYTTLSLIGGGWYYWNGGYWYPAWGYDDSAAYYPYDGPIYSGHHARPFDQVVADVQSALQEQGYYHGEVDGLLGPLTRQALAQYQHARGLYATEAIDQPTLESLGMG